MNKSTMIQDRDRDFASACRQHARQAVERGERVSQSDIVSRAINTPAPGYYVTFEYARKRLYASRSGASGASKGSHRDAMWREIEQKVRQKMESRGMSMSDALQDVLAGGMASRFFLTPGYATKLYQHLRHRRRPLERPSATIC